MKKTLLIICVLHLSACALGPDYNGVDVNSALIDKEWTNPLPHEGKVEDLSLWWTQFDDPVLNKLIEVSQKDSPTLDIALAKIAQARANANKNIADSMPNITLAGSVDNTQTIGEKNNSQLTTNRAGFDAGWEIDLFGGKRRAIQQANALLQASQANWHDARITLAAEVADAYVSYRACEATVLLFEKNLNSQVATRDMVKYKVKAGLVAFSEENLSEATTNNSASSLENKKGLCAQNINTLVNLTAISAEVLKEQLKSSSRAIPAPRELNITAIPAQAIEQRPDVDIAENNIAAASAAIGVAQAKLYPSLSLSGAITINQTSGSSSLSSWSYGPSITVPIFNAGSLRADVKRAIGQYDESLANYKITVRNAVKEVEDALARIKSVTNRIDYAKKAVEQYRQFLSTTEISYNAGSTSLLDLEEARRSTYAAEEALISVYLERAQSWISLYKAVGGGWNKNMTDRK